MQSGESHIFAAISDSMKIRWLPVSPFVLLVITVASVHSHQVSAPVWISGMQSRVSFLSSELHSKARSEAHSADAEIFLKGAIWALKYEPEMPPADRTLVEHSIERARSRIL